MHDKVENNTKYDPHFTDSVIAATGPNATLRLKQIMPALLRHLHDFARDVDLTVAEWMAGVKMVSTQLTCSLSSLLLPFPPRGL
jgi:hypothetical protein